MTGKVFILGAIEGVGGRMENTVMQLVRLAAAVVLAVAAQYLALRIFDRFTTRIDEVAELKKGNAAVGIVLGSIMVSVAMIVAGGLAAMVPSDPNLLKTDFWGGLFSGALNIAAAIILAVAAQFLALSVFDKMTKTIDVQEELKKRNLGVALLLAAIIFGVAAVIQAGAPRF